MKAIDLSMLDCFKQEDRLANLNDYAEVNQSLMPHSIAAATGCRLEEALTLLLMLYGEYLAEGYLLVYHTAHPDFPVERRQLSEGLPPKGPYKCPECDTLEVPDSEVVFDLEFFLNEPMKFIVAT